MTTSKGRDGGPGGKRLTNRILSCMKLYFLWASSCLKCQPTAKVKDRVKTRKKKKKFKSFFLSYKARCAHQGGRDKVSSVRQSAPTPLFLDFNALEKALISWVQYFKIETQTSFSMNIQKSIKYLNVYKIGWTHWEGASAVPYGTPPDQ